MTTSEALEFWLHQNLPVRGVFREVASVMEDQLPGALIRFYGVRPGDTMDARMHVERYQVALMAPVLGAQEQPRAADLASLERALIDAARSPRRATEWWEHIEVEFREDDRSAGIAVYDVSLYVR